MVIFKRVASDATIDELKTYMQNNHLQKIHVCVTDETSQEFFEIKSVGMVFID